jgi:hypothetical protein
MERIEKTVFLSYRRTNFPWALAIFQNLTHNGFDVFSSILMALPVATSSASSSET